MHACLRALLLSARTAASALLLLYERSACVCCFMRCCVSRCAHRRCANPSLLWRRIKVTLVVLFQNQPAIAADPQR